MDSIKFYLNSDHSIQCTYKVDGGELVVDAFHSNPRNVKNIVTNISKVIKAVVKDRAVEVCLDDMPYAKIDLETGKVENINTLTSFETRLYARTSSQYTLPFDRRGLKPNTLKTDLHTHFAAALSPEQLLEVAEGKGVLYPVSLIQKINLRTDNLNKLKNPRGEDCYRLDDLIQEKDNRRLLLDSLKIDTSVQETFNKMEDVYTMRGPITKNPNLFEDMCFAIAKDAQSQGTKYIEFSLSSIISNAEQIRQVEEIMPKIEEEYGVKIRFLGALSRHSDYEWNEDEVERLKISAKCPYIVGCDVMGHETNPTKDFADHIKALAKYAMQKDPDFVIRVHAGENILFKTNVRQALLAVEAAHHELLEETHQDFPFPQVRIGHGIYGFNESPDYDESERTQKISTEQLFKMINPIVEFNLSSNLSLNNIDGLDQIPIKDYIDSGIRVVLGTDGKGIYSTNIDQEVIIAHEAGVTVSDFDKISATEDEIIAKSDKRFARLFNLNPSTYKAIEEEQKKIDFKYTPQVQLHYEQELAECQNRLHQIIKDSGAITDMSQIKRDLAGKCPILITGSSHKHFPNIEKHPDQLAKIREVFDVLVHLIDTKKAYFVTGGTNHGVEKELHQIAHDYIARNKSDLIVLGTLTEEAAKNSISPDERLRETNKVERDTITHAITPVKNGKIAKRWFDLPDTVLDMVQTNNGIMIAIGGGAIVGDMILRAHNMGVNMQIMSSVVGASSEKAESLKGNGYGFEDVKELVHTFKNRYPYLIKDISESELERLIARAKQKFEGEQISNSVAVSKRSAQPTPLKEATALNKTSNNNQQQF